MDAGIKERVRRADAADHLLWSFVTALAFLPRYKSGSVTPDSQVADLLRGELANLFAGTFFVFVGLTAWLIAAVRRRGGVRILIWLGWWSAMFGVQDFLHSPAVIAALPASFGGMRAFVLQCCAYLVIVAATLSFLELTLGTLRRFLRIQLVADVVVALLAIGWFLISGSENTFLIYNQLLAVVILTLLLVTVSVPKLSQRYMVLSHHRVLTAGTLIFAAEALLRNAARPLRHEIPGIYGTIGFAVLLLSFGWTALELVLSSERRLLAIDSELAIARELQFSILPVRPPETAGLQIAATYEPMTAVAGDFYEFLPVDAHRAGFLVADVSGHGVPAALIAAMIKVATQSVIECASDPGEVLRRLGKILSSHLRGQFVSAAYLWIDTEAGCARYSAAGHPPLLRWSETTNILTRIESNGLLFGVRPDCAYPSCEIPLASGDRLLLYTDGVTEPENGAGEAFGDKRLAEIVRQGESLTAAELSRRILSELRAWQPESQNQQDDITLLVIDVAASGIASTVHDLDSSQLALPVSS